MMRICTLACLPLITAGFQEHSHVTDITAPARPQKCLEPSLNQLECLKDVLPSVKNKMVELCGRTGFLLCAQRYKVVDRIDTSVKLGNKKVPSMLKKSVGMLERFGKSYPSLRHALDQMHKEQGF